MRPLQANSDGGFDVAVENGHGTGIARVIRGMERERHRGRSASETAGIRVPVYGATEYGARPPVNGIPCACAGLGVDAVCQSDAAGTSVQRLAPSGGGIEFRWCFHQEGVPDRLARQANALCRASREHARSLS